MIDDKPAYRDELLAWSRQAVDRVQGFYNSAYSASNSPEPRFTFVRSTGPEEEEFAGPPSVVIGE